MGKVAESKYIFDFDVETTGLCFNSPSPVLNDDGKHHQIVSIGIIVVDGKTLKEIEHQYFEIKWTDESKKQQSKDPNFGIYAEGIHGLTQEYLDENGLDEEEAVLQIAQLIIKYWGTYPITVMGHNVMTFDVPFLRDMMSRYDIDVLCTHRHCDSSAAGFAAFGVSSSDGLMEVLGMDDRNDHNALFDARFSLRVFQVIRKLIESIT